MHHELGGARYAAFRADGTLFPTPREVGLDSRDDPADPKLYPGDGGFQLAELPYKGGQLSMVILLPHSRGGLAALERQLDAGRLAAWISRLEHRRTGVYLPRFGLEQGRELRAPLEAMGMKRAFVSGSAQFDGMTAGTNPADALFVGAVLHKAFLEVNEKGTEAAAATAVVVPMLAAAPKRTMPFVPTFRADRPFLFLIRDGSSGAILFIGRFARP
jgi:serine protease inhibitor